MLDFNDSRLTLPEGGLRQRMQVNVGVASMRKAPQSDATQVSQVLFGETVILHHEEGEFALVQNETDHYVGWVLMAALSTPILAPTHRVATTRCHSYAAPSVTAVPRFMLGRSALLTATGTEDGAYVEFERVGWIAAHLAVSLDQLHTDPAAVAEQFIGTPYLWGGRTAQGLDCSALVQLAFGVCGVLCPRDSDMQHAWCGEEICNWNALGSFRRGDLIFWKGHVGIMLDPETLLHANGTFMTTMKEPLRPAIERIAKEYGEPVGARRIDVSNSVGVTPAWFTPQARPLP